MKAITLGLLLVAINGATWLSNFDEATEIALRDNKFILLNFSGSDWCGPCIRMKKEAFESKAFLSLAGKNLVLVRADFPRSKKNKLPDARVKHNEKLAEKYNPQGKFPYTLLLDAKGNVVKTWAGYVPSSQDKFLNELADMLPVR